MSDWTAVFIFLTVGIIFGAGGVVTSFLIHPRRANVAKGDAYECGLTTIGDTWVQFRTSYFLYALLSLIFAVEIIYLYPWAVAFQELGLRAFIKMIIFITILVAGLWYAWKEGALEWQ